MSTFLARSVDQDHCECLQHAKHVVCVSALKHRMLRSLALLLHCLGVSLPTLWRVNRNMYVVLPADVEYLQSTWGYAAPEVLEYNLQPDNDELFWKISFQGQDCWSLGCVLVWLLIGTDPFTIYDEEYREMGLGGNTEYQQALRKRQAAWVSCCCYRCLL